MSVARGFTNAFKNIGFECRTFDLMRLKLSFISGAKRELIAFAPDVIFTSVENIHYLPLDQLNNCNLALWGQFYEHCSFEKQIVTIGQETKNQLIRYRDKHRILIWSQHSDAINDRFFKGYQKELGLEFVQLMHCADKSQFIEPVAEPAFDFIWIGNVGHRKDMYNSVVLPLKKSSANFIEFTESNPISPDQIFEQKYYSKAQIAINVHTKAQLEHHILLNERVFSSSLQGGFQACDNLLARQYFTEDELVIANKPADYYDLLMFYKSNPVLRVAMIKRMQQKILDCHLYEHRVNQVLDILN
ncbi:MAG: glycosyltransferase family protein [Agriterribacter sp.]